MFSNYGINLGLTTTFAKHNANTCLIVSLLSRQISHIWETPSLSKAILLFVTGQEFEVDAELLDILCCEDIQKNRVGAN